jgi:hypothetical protein
MLKAATPLTLVALILVPGSRSPELAALGLGWASSPDSVHSGMRDRDWVGAVVMEAAT